MTTLDARGVSCPEPLLMLKSALKNESSIELLVDSKNAFENCESYAKKLGFTVEFEKNDDTYKMQIKGKNE
ncbi:MAG: sulfurtransferase TusA family protein [Oscillospiraceae bacterium]|nr:sulfurtransferase TusA family protein [Oscillospiraceae bacterium]MCL2278363.1 sulfurtransferase TusA family protein [Oscillospiraceae bacterium]